MKSYRPLLLAHKEYVQSVQSPHDKRTIDFAASHIQVRARVGVISQRRLI